MKARTRRSWPVRLAWGMAVLVPLLLGIRIGTTGVGIDNNLQAILPGGAGAAVEIRAIRQAEAAGAARIAIGLEGGTPAQRRRGAAQLDRALTQSGLFIAADTDVADTLDWLRAHGQELTCPVAPEDLNEAWADGIVDAARRLLFSGLVPLGGANLNRDPFLLHLTLSDCLLPRTQTVPDVADASGRAQSGASGQIIVSGRLTASPFDLDTQRRVTDVLATWRSDPSNDGVDLLRSGAVFFAAEAGRTARREITVVGGISILLILILYSAAFRHPSTAGIALLTVVAGALGGAWLCIVVFGAVHFSVFVFGSALTGVSADYAVHSLAARRAHPVGGQRGLARALTISMVTTVAGFAALLGFGIEVFRQIGVFASGGLFFAWLFALLALPRLDRWATPGQSAPALLARPVAALRRTAQTRGLTALLLVLVAGAGIWGGQTASFEDDIRRFQTLDPGLSAEQRNLKSREGAQYSPRFVLSSGETLEQALRAEEAMLARTPALADKVLAYSRFAPSEAQRAINLQAYRDHLSGDRLDDWRAVLGLAPQSRAGDGHSAPSPQGAPHIAPSPPAWLGALKFEHGGQVFLLAPVLSGADISEAGRTIRLIDPVETYAGTLSAYRDAAGMLFVVATLAAAICLMLIYRSLRALWLVVPPVMACILALSVPAIFGMPLTLFSVLALFIVLGAGIDFSVFQWEMGHKERQWTGVAVLVAACSTCAAMGMLSVSQTLPVQSFGMTIAIGVLGSMFFSFLAPLVAPSAISGDEDRL